MNETTTIEVRINGKDRAIPPDLSVTDLLEWLDLNPALVVVEMNREILDRGSYEKVFIVAEDVLELVHFVGGG